MDVREKLVELLDIIIQPGQKTLGDIADYLIANGVTIMQMPTIAAVPVSELEKLRDYLYAEDLIFMRGLAELNKLIANYGAKMDEVIE